MTGTERLAEEMRETARVLGCRIVVLPPHGSDDEPVEILP